ncbi:MAG: hypothetical protein HQM09_03100 [Candidatus Riflebacteria bacterium]|nr:hypothetical protein [Candidatus Riflebacteria bacterium]
MKCEELRERMLDPKSHLGITQDSECSIHLSNCPECRAQFAVERALVNGFSALAELQPPVRLAERVLKIPTTIILENRVPFWHKIFWGTGFSLALAGLLLMVSPRNETLVTIHQAPSTKIAQEHTTTASTVPIPTTEMRLAAASPESKKLPSVSMTNSSVAGRQMPASDISSASGFSIAAIPTTNNSTQGKSGNAPGTITIAMASRPTSPLPTSVVPAISAQVHDLNVRIALSAKSKQSQVESASNEYRDKNILPPIIRGESLSESNTTEMPIARSSKNPTEVAGAAEKSLKDHEEISFCPSPQRSKTSGSSNSFAAFYPESKQASKQPASSQMESPLSAQTAPSEFSEDKICMMKSDTTAVPGQSSDSSGSSPPPTSPSVNMPKKQSIDSTDSSQLFDEKKQEKEQFIQTPIFSQSPTIVKHQKRLESILERHLPRIREGPLDLNQWVIDGWINIKERIELAPPETLQWFARQQEGIWRVFLESTVR